MTDLIIPSAAAEVTAKASTTTEIMEIAEAFSQSNLVGKNGGYSKQDLFVIFLIAKSVGLHAVAALREVYFIDGKPMISSAAGRSLIKGAGHRFRDIEWNANICHLRAWRKDEKEPYDVVYKIEEAKHAGLTNRKTWAQHPKPMLFAAATRRMVQMVFPDVLLGVGVYDREEFDQTPANRARSYNNGLSLKSLKESEE